jgi:hypothetical protein
VINRVSYALLSVTFVACLLKVACSLVHLGFALLSAYSFTLRLLKVA